MTGSEAFDATQIIMDWADRSKITWAEAAEELKRKGIPGIDQAVEELKRGSEALIVVPNAVLGDRDRVNWYMVPSRDGCWAAYWRALEEAGAPGMGGLDDETSDIVRLLANPRRKGDRRKGLVVGNVQSGKTRNFAGVIAKAADAGYRLIIVLAGMHNNLREQTQTRLDEQLFTGDDWGKLTGPSKDFDHQLSPRASFKHTPLLCAVVKKNKKVLQKLVEMLGDLGPDVLQKFPVLIIDDEADQASPNSRSQYKEVSAVNEKLRQLWGKVITGTYVAYTATPFANVLINPDDKEDLFPSDFIVTLEPGEGYFGPEKVFGVADTVDEDAPAAEGLDVVRRIPPEESDQLRPPSETELREKFDPPLSPTLKDAIAWFVVATAIRWQRGQQAEHSSMLVHTTHYKNPHFAFKERIKHHVKDLVDEVAAGEIERFEKAWKKEAYRVAAEATIPLPVWTEVRARLGDVLTEIDVKVDNGDSPDRINYQRGKPLTVIAVGGGTLSRGLTLEGLVVSYFTRTSNTYDTLMQMGRWFGYRKGYEDLPRIWVANDLDRDYAFLALVEKDLRDSIKELADSEFTPYDVGLRIRAHPGRLQITSASKMFSAKEVQVGLSGTANQTFLLDGRPGVLDRNRSVAEELIGDATLRPTPREKGRLIATGVPGERVVRFLENFKVHDDQKWLTNPDALRGMSAWIRKWASGPDWNVVIAGGSGKVAKDGHTDLGKILIGGREVNCLDRSPLIGSTRARIDLKAIMSGDDRLGDIHPDRYRATKHTNNVERRRIRRHHGQGKGLVVVYPISANSRAEKTAGGPRTRMDMPAGENLIGFAIFFPHVNDEHGREGTYVSVRSASEDRMAEEEG